MPLVRFLALRYGFFDMPDKTLKTHTSPTPRLGGVAIFLAIITVLFITRLTTDYPTGTIRNFRYILSGASIIFLLGLADDLKKGGLNYISKFAGQFLASAVLLLAPISMKFFTPAYLSAVLSLIWVVGITNALNLVDIQDGLAASQAAIAAAAFLAISFPSEEIYVNILAAALLGGILGFLPYNFSAKRKMFMGDSGSLTLGYFLAVLALGCSYSSWNPYAVYAPILILGVPMFETFFLIYIRLSRGLSPFRGSRDHTAHHLEKLHFSQLNILITMGSAAAVLSFLAFLITRVENHAVAVWIYALIIIEVVVVARWLQRSRKNWETMQ